MKYNKDRFLLKKEVDLEKVVFNNFEAKSNSQDPVC